MYGRGEFTMRPQYAWHRMTVDVWRSMTEVQLQRAREVCFSLQGARRLSPRTATLRSCTSRAQARN